MAAGSRPIRIAIALAASMLVWPAAPCAATFATSSVEARGLTAGPFITDAGDVWDSQSGVMLTNHTGVSSILAPADAPNWDNFVDLTWFGAGWWAQARPSGVLAGRIGGRLRKLALLSRCNPGSPKIPPATAQYAISAGHLYAMLPAPCFANARPDGGVVLEIDLRSRRRRVLARVAGTLDDIAASGKYVAIAYTRRSVARGIPSRPEHPARRTTVLRARHQRRDGRTGQPVNPPPTPGISQSNASGLQVDNHGDMLRDRPAAAQRPGCSRMSRNQIRSPNGDRQSRRSSVGIEAELGRDAVIL